MKILLIVIGFLIAFCAIAKEGGNGGYGYVCRAPNGKIISARLLDLWEPETFRAYSNNSITVDKQIDLAVKKVEAFFQQQQRILKVS